MVDVTISQYAYNKCPQRKLEEACLNVPNSHVKILWDKTGHNIYEKRLFSIFEPLVPECPLVL